MFSDTQMYCRFVDDISIKMWVAKDKVDDMITKIKLDLNSWHACIKIDPIVHTVTDPRGANTLSYSHATHLSVRSDFCARSDF